MAGAQQWKPFPPVDAMASPEAPLGLRSTVAGSMAAHQWRSTSSGNLDYTSVHVDLVADPGESSGTTRIMEKSEEEKSSKKVEVPQVSHLCEEEGTNHKDLQNFSVKQLLKHTKSDGEEADCVLDNIDQYDGIEMVFPIIKSEGRKPHRGSSTCFVAPDWTHICREMLESKVPDATNLAVEKSFANAFESMEAGSVGERSEDWSTVSQSEADLASSAEFENDDFEVSDILIQDVDETKSEVTDVEELVEYFPVSLSMQQTSMDGTAASISSARQKILREETLAAFSSAKLKILLDEAEEANTSVKQSHEKMTKVSPVNLNTFGEEAVASTSSANPKTSDESADLRSSVATSEAGSSLKQEKQREFTELETQTPRLSEGSGKRKKGTDVEEVEKSFTDSSAMQETSMKGTAASISSVAETAIWEEAVAVVSSVKQEIFLSEPEAANSSAKQSHEKMREVSSACQKTSDEPTDSDSWSSVATSEAGSSLESDAERELTELEMETPRLSECKTEWSQSTDFEEVVEPFSVPLATQETSMKGTAASISSVTKTALWEEAVAVLSSMKSEPEAANSSVKQSHANMREVSSACQKTSDEPTDSDSWSSVTTSEAGSSLEPDAKREFIGLDMETPRLSEGNGEREQDTDVEEVEKSFTDSSAMQETSMKGTAASISSVTETALWEEAVAVLSSMKQEIFLSEPEAANSSVKQSHANMTEVSSACQKTSDEPTDSDSWSSVATSEAGSSLEPDAEREFIGLEMQTPRLSEGKTEWSQSTDFEEVVEPFSVPLAMQETSMKGTAASISSVTKTALWEEAVAVLSSMKQEIFLSEPEAANSSVKESHANMREVSSACQKTSDEPTDSDSWSSVATSEAGSSLEPEKEREFTELEMQTPRLLEGNGEREQGTDFKEVVEPFSVPLTMQETSMDEAVASISSVTGTTLWEETVAVVSSVKQEILLNELEAANSSVKQSHANMTEVSCRCQKTSDEPTDSDSWLSVATSEAGSSLEPEEGREFTELEMQTPRLSEGKEERAESTDFEEVVVRFPVPLAMQETSMDEAVASISSVKETALWEEPVAVVSSVKQEVFLNGPETTNYSVKQSHAYMTEVSSACQKTSDEPTDSDSWLSVATSEAGSSLEPEKEREFTELEMQTPRLSEDNGEREQGTDVEEVEKSFTDSLVMQETSMKGTVESISSVTDTALWEETVAVVSSVKQERFLSEPEAANSSAKQSHEKMTEISSVNQYIFQENPVASTSLGKPKTLDESGDSWLFVAASEAGGSLEPENKREFTELKMQTRRLSDGKGERAKNTDTEKSLESVLVSLSMQETSMDGTAASISSAMQTTLREETVAAFSSAKLEILLDEDGEASTSVKQSHEKMTEVSPVNLNTFQEEAVASTSSANPKTSVESADLRSSDATSEAGSSLEQEKEREFTDLKVQTPRLPECKGERAKGTNVKKSVESVPVSLSMQKTSMDDTAASISSVTETTFREEIVAAISSANQEILLDDPEAISSSAKHSHEEMTEVSSVNQNMFQEEPVPSTSSANPKTSDEPAEADSRSSMPTSEAGISLGLKKEREFTDLKMQTPRWSDRVYTTGCGEPENAYTATQRAVLSNAKVHAWLVGNSPRHAQSANFEYHSTKEHHGNKNNGRGMCSGDAKLVQNTQSHFTSDKIVDCISHVEDSSDILAPSTCPSNWHKGSASQVHEIAEERRPKRKVDILNTKSREAVQGTSESAVGRGPPAKSSSTSPPSSSCSRILGAAKPTSMIRPRLMSTRGRPQLKNTSEQAQSRPVPLLGVYIPPPERQIQEKSAAVPLQIPPSPVECSRRKAKASVPRVSRPIPVPRRVITKIDFLGEQMHLINFDNHPYVPTHEIVEKLTKFNGVHMVIKILEARNASVPFCDLSRELRPDLFEHIDQSDIWDSYRSSNRDSLHIMPLKSVPFMMNVLLVQGPFGDVVKELAADFYETHKKF